MIKKAFLILTIIFVSVGFSKAQMPISKAFSESISYEASKDYYKAISVLPENDSIFNYEIFLRKGYLHYMLYNYSESIRYYDKAIAIHPNSVEARLGYTLPASVIGKWDEIMHHYQEILKINPGNLTVNYKTGLIFYGREDFQSAKKYFESIARNYPFDYDGVNMLAWTYLKLNDTQNSKKMFERILLIKPDDTQALEMIETLSQ